MAKGGALDLTIHIAGKVDKSLTSAINITQRNVSSLATNLSRIGTAGLAAMGTLATGTIAAINKCTNEAQDFEKQMADVVKYVDGLADATGKISDKMDQSTGRTFVQNYDMMKDAIMDLAAQIPYTREELTKLAASAGQSGYSIGDLIQYDSNGQIQGFLRDVAMWGTAMDIEADLAGQYAAKWEKAFNMDHAQIMDVADVINYLGANTATTAAEIANAVNSAASLGQIAGVDVKATAALADAMLATGVSSDRVGTSLKRIYTNVSKGASATKAQKAAWEELGFSATGIAKAMQSDGPGTLLKVFEAINQMPAERQVATLSSLFGQWAIEGAAKITGNIETYTNALRMANDPSLYKGSMEREFVIKANTTEAVQQMTQQAISNLEIGIGDAFLPVKKQFLLGITDFTNALRKDTPQIEAIAGKLADVVALAMDKLGKGLQDSLPYIEKGLDYLLENGDKVAKTIGGIALAFAGMKAAPLVEGALSLGGNLLFGGGAAAGKAGGGLMSTLGSLFTGGVNAKNNLVGGAGVLMQGAGLGIKYQASGKGGLFGNIGSGLMGMLGAGQNMSSLMNPKTSQNAMWNLGTSLFQSHLNGGGLGGMIGNMFKGSKAGQGITSYLGAVGGQLGGLKNNPIVSGIGGALGQAGGFVGSGFKGLGQGFGMLGQYLGGAIASSKPGQLIGGALGKVGSVGSAVMGGIGNIGGALVGPLGAIGNLGGGILGTLTTAAGPITGIFGSIISGALPIVGIISSIIAVVSILGDNLDGIRGIVQNVFGDQGVAIFDTFIGKIQEIGTFIQGLFGTGLIELMAPLKESITNMFGEDAGAAFGGITEILQSVMNVIQQIVDFSVTYVKPIIEEVINFIVQDALPIVLQTISAAAPFISQIITTIGSMIMRVAQVIAQAIQFAWPFIQQILTAVLQFAQGAIPKLLEAVNVVATNVGGYINAIIGVFTNLIDFIGNVFTGNWEAAWENVKAIFSNAFDALVELAKIPINAVIGIINGAIAGINSIVGGGITIPEWVPVIGGGTWSLQLPEIPYLAKGGFTNGPSIAGEAGTEAVISFASGVRNQNIATWAQAGQMLGIDALERPSEVSLADIGDYGVSSGGAVTFSPQITINGNADDAVMDRAIAKMQSEFETWYRNMKRREARTRY